MYNEKKMNFPANTIFLFVENQKSNQQSMMLKQILPQEKIHHSVKKKLIRVVRFKTDFSLLRNENSTAASQKGRKK